MSFLDLFKPKWKHSSLDARVGAISKLVKVSTLCGLAQKDEIERVRHAAIARLIEILNCPRLDYGSPGHFEKNENIIDNKRKVVSCLVNIDDPIAADGLIQYLEDVIAILVDQQRDYVEKDTHAWLGRDVIESIGSTGDKRAVKPLITYLNSTDCLRDGGAGGSIGIALGKIGDIGSILPLLKSYDNYMKLLPYGAGKVKEEELKESIIEGLKAILRKNGEIAETEILNAARQTEYGTDLIEKVVNRRALATLDGFIDVEFNFRYGCPLFKENPVLIKETVRYNPFGILFTCPHYPSLCDACSGYIKLRYEEENHNVVNWSLYSSDGADSLYRISNCSSCQGRLSVYHKFQSPDTQMVNEDGFYYGECRACNKQVSPIRY